MVNRIYTFKNPALREISESIDVADAKEIVTDLKDTLKDLGPYGSGLSAVQIGVLSRVFVMQEQITTHDEPKIIVLINPEVENVFKGPALSSYEGCLSIPGVFTYVKRPASVTMSYFDEEGKKQRAVFNAQGAAVALHEYDHLNGIWFVDRAFNRYYRKDFWKKYKVKLIAKSDIYNYV
jgi:peptide deformylase